jgi:DNA-binding IclR family transcriptional regulator
MRRPLNCTALGKAILAYLPAEEREEVFSLLAFKLFTHHTVRDLPHLKKELAKVRQQGYALDEQETVLGARCVAAPVMDRSGKVAAAISVSGPTTRITRERIQSIAGTVLEGARAISMSLGYSERKPRR